MGKNKSSEPQINDWLFSCSADMKVEDIATTLEIVGQPVTELSALHWQTTWQIGNDMLRAYGYPKSYLYEAGQSVSWDAISDRIFEKSFERDPFVKDDRKNNRFVGEIIVIRDCRKEISVNLATCMECAQRYIEYIHPWLLRSKARVLIVLAGWSEPILHERIRGYRVSWKLNTLPVIQASFVF